MVLVHRQVTIEFGVHNNDYNPNNNLMLIYDRFLYSSYIFEINVLPYYVYIEERERMGGI